MSKVAAAEPSAPGLSLMSAWVGPILVVLATACLLSGSCLVLVGLMTESAATHVVWGAGFTFTGERAPPFSLLTALAAVAADSDAPAAWPFMIA